MLFSKNSQLILRHHKIFQNKKLFITGNIQDEYPLYLSSISTTINIQKYNDYIRLKKKILKISVFIIIY